MVGVNYKGGGPAMIDVMGGHVSAFFAGVSSSTPLIKSGKLRALGGGREKSEDTDRVVAITCRSVFIEGGRQA